MCDEKYEPVSDCYFLSIFELDHVIPNYILMRLKGCLFVQDQHTKFDFRMLLH
jgi:hypothetical protein